jgi:hypothetical protein
LLALFSFLQLMLLVFFGPGGGFGDYSDYWYYQDMASRLDSGYYPYIHYWVEYPPLFPWLPVGAYALSKLLAPAANPYLWFYVVFGSLMGVFAIGNLILVYNVGGMLYDKPRALRISVFYGLLFGAIFVHAGWFDGVPLFFLLLSLYLLLRNRATFSGATAALGTMLKVLPLILLPVGLKVLPRRWRFLVSFAVVVIAVNLPFLIVNPVMFVASWKGLLTQPSWETVWALLDGYWSYGLVTGNRFEPAEAGGGQRPEFVPWLLVVAVFGLVYLLLYLLPWQRREWQVGAEDEDRQEPGRSRVGSWVRGILPQFRHPILGEPDQSANWLGIVAFVGLSLNLFMVFSKGWSPQFVLWYLPFLVLVMPNGWGLAYATLLTASSVVERVFYFLVLPDARWLMAGVVIYRTVLLLALVPEFLAVMGFVRPSRWNVLRRRLAVPVVLATLVMVGLGAGGFARDYNQSRYAENEQRPSLERVLSSALAGDGVVVTSRKAFDAVAHYLPEQEVRLWTRDDGEFRPAAFEEQWSGFLAQHSQIWLLADYAGGQGADWNAYLAERLASEGYLASEEWVGDEQKLSFYALGKPTDERVEVVDSILGDEIALRRIKLDSSALQAGQVLRTTVRWEPVGEQTDKHKLFLHLETPSGTIVAQRDADLELLGRGQRVGLHLPRDLPEGTYRLRVGIYDPVTGERLTLSSGEDSLLLEGVLIR